MQNRLPTRTFMFLGAMYAALTLGAAGAQAAKPVDRKVPLSAVSASQGTFNGSVSPFRWALKANPGIVDGAPHAGQVLLRGSRRHTCRTLHVDYRAGGQAQSAALLLRREGQPDVAVDTESETPGTLDATLRPGRSWRLAASTPSISISVYANGSLRCRSAKGVG